MDENMTNNNSYQTNNSNMITNLQNIPETISRNSGNISRQLSDTANQNETIAFMVEQEAKKKVNPADKIQQGNNDITQNSYIKHTEAQIKELVNINNNKWENMQNRDVSGYKKRFINRVHKHIFKLIQKNVSVDIWPLSEKYFYQEQWMMIEYVTTKFGLNDLQMAYFVFLNEKYNIEQVNENDISWCNIPLMTNFKKNHFDGLINQILQFCFIHQYYLAFWTLNKFSDEENKEFVVTVPLQDNRILANEWKRVIFGGDPFINPQQLNVVYSQLIEEREQEVNYELFLYTLFENIDEENGYNNYTKYFDC